MNAIVIALIATVVVLTIAFVVVRKAIGGRAVPDVLRVGRTVPTFAAIDETGSSLSSSSLRGQPAVVLFVRGNWCPFCSRQVANLAKTYKAIAERGARLILVTPKPLETTRRVAEFFEFEFDYWLDQDLAAARDLGLLVERGVPDEHRGEYGEDTLWPASLVLDADGVIRFAEVSKIIADRPNPEKFLRVLDELS